MQHLIVTENYKLEKLKTPCKFTILEILNDIGNKPHFSNDSMEKNLTIYMDSHHNCRTASLALSNIASTNECLLKCFGFYNKTPDSNTDTDISTTPVPIIDGQNENSNESSETWEIKVPIRCDHVIEDHFYIAEDNVSDPVNYVYTRKEIKYPDNNPDIVEWILERATNIAHYAIQWCEISGKFQNLLTLQQMC